MICRVGLTMKKCGVDIDKASIGGLFQQRTKAHGSPHRLPPPDISIALRLRVLLPTMIMLHGKAGAVGRERGLSCLAAPGIQVPSSRWSFDIGLWTSKDRLTRRLKAPIISPGAEIGSSAISGASYGICGVIADTNNLTCGQCPRSQLSFELLKKPFPPCVSLFCKPSMTRS